MTTSMGFLTQNGCKAQGSLQPMDNGEINAESREMILSKEEPLFGYLITNDQPGNHIQTSNNMD